MRYGLGYVPPAPSRRGAPTDSSSLREAVVGRWYVSRVFEFSTYRVRSCMKKTINPSVHRFMAEDKRNAFRDRSSSILQHGVVSSTIPWLLVQIQLVRKGF